MFRSLVVLCCVLSLNAQLIAEEQHPAPEPYSFAFSSPNEDGTASSREETGDANGRITGSYTILGADGQQRRVEYVADENGFRANVITNEIGTESQNAADVQYQSSAPTAAELTAQWEASGAGRARLHNAGPIGGQILTAPVPRPVIRAPLNAIQEGLVASPIAPIGGGFAAVQGLGFNQGLRLANPIQGPLLRPISRAARLPLPVAAVPIAPVAVPISAPLAGPIGVGVGFTRAQSIGPIGAGFVGAGVQPFGVRVANGGNALNLGQYGVTPLGVNGASFQQLNAVRGLHGGYGDLRGLALGNQPLNNGGNGFLLLSNGVQPHIQHASGASTNVITQRTESDLEEKDYGRKSK